MCAKEMRLCADGAITVELDDVEYNILLAVLTGDFSETGFVRNHFLSTRKLKFRKRTVQQKAKLILRLLSVA